MKKNILAWIMDVSTKHPFKVLIIFIVIAILMGGFAAQLTIDTSLESAFGDEMPDDVQEFEKVSSKFGEHDTVTVVVDCSDSNRSNAESFLQDLGSELKEIRYFTNIQYTQSMNFGENKSIMYVPHEQLRFLLDPNATKESVQATYSMIMAKMNKSSYIVSDNGEILLLNMILDVKIDSADIRTKLFEDLESILDYVQKSEQRYSDLDVGYTGSMVVMDHQGDELALGDMYTSLIITFILILILLFISFRSISLPMLSLGPLLFGILITAGLISLTIGALSIMSAVFAVLLLGLGIDFSIHILTRFTEEMEKHDDMTKAFEHTSVNTGKAVILGGLTTTAAFGALMFSKVQGLQEMGLILAIGLIVTIACVFFTLPAMITLRLKRGKLRKKMHKKKTKFGFLKRIGKFSAKHAVVMVVILVIVLSFFAYNIPSAELNSDMSSIQPKTVPAYKQLEKVKDNFNYSEDSIMVVADSYEELEQNVRELKKIPEVMEVESILDYLPKNQSVKLQIFKQAKQIHPEFSDILWLNINRMSWRDLPKDFRKDWVSEEGDDIKFLIKIKPEGNLWNKEYRMDLYDSIEKIDKDYVSRASMINSLMDAIKDDVIRVSMIAGLPILLIAYIGFRELNPLYALLALTPVIFGIGGIVGLSKLLSVDLNIISIMMIPLVIGIGIDNGIHIIHRYKEDGNGSLPNVIQHTGKAIFLTTASTCLAFSSFTIADHPGMQSLGRVPVLGLILAFIAAAVFLPSLIKLILYRFQKK